MSSVNQINDLRSRVLRGEKISTEEYRLVLASLRTARAEDIAKAVEKKEKALEKASKEKEPKVDIDLNALFKKGA